MMIKKYLITLLCTWLTVSSWAQYDASVMPNGQLPWPQNVQARISELLQLPMFQTTTVGLMVYDLTDDCVIYQHNHRLHLRPASTMKLLTAIAAIDRLGNNYRLYTSLYYKGEIVNGTLWGNLYCVGGMDPSFDSEDMTAFVQSIRDMGIDTIRGYIVTDCSMKDTLRWGEGWCWDDDNPTLSPLLIQRKPNFMERFINEMYYNGIVFADVYSTQGVVPQDAVCICTRTHSIDQVLMQMMKESDNLYAECMLYQLAASSGNRPATAKDAQTLMQELIRRLGLNPKDYRLADGSGLSLYNYLTAELEVQLLRYAWRNELVYQQLIPTLPIAGEDGTLRRRMRELSTRGNVRAKTGTLTGISALAGYCMSANGHQLCFAIINQGVMQNDSGRNFQDRVCKALCE